jgi:hypothetical protein
MFELSILFAMPRCYSALLLLECIKKEERKPAQLFISGNYKFCLSPCHFSVVAPYSISNICFSCTSYYVLFLKNHIYEFAIWIINNINVYNAFTEKRDN